MELPKKIEVTLVDGGKLLPMKYDEELKEVFEYANQYASQILNEINGDYYVPEEVKRIIENNHRCSGPGAFDTEIREDPEVDVFYFDAEHLMIGCYYVIPETHFHTDLFPEDDIQPIGLINLLKVKEVDVLGFGKIGCKFYVKDDVDKPSFIVYSTYHNLADKLEFHWSQF